MRISIKTLIVVLLAVMSFAAAPAVHAGEVKDLSGTVDYVDPGGSEIGIINDEDGETVIIIGFPFHNLEVQLDDELDPLDPDEDGITIDAGDCVSITYYEKYDEVNKWLSLTMYCEECSGCYVDDDDDMWHCDAAETAPCFEDEDGLEREPQENQNRPNPWPSHGKPPGQRR